MWYRLYHRYQDAQSKIISRLFIVLACLQIMDAHSTLISIGKRQELSHIILYVADLISIEMAVIIFKVIDLIVVGALFLCWKRSKAIYAAHFFMCLVLLITAYTWVIISNYIG